MSHLKTFTRTALLTAALAAGAAGLSTAPAAAAAAPCQVSGEGPTNGAPENEWALIVTFRSKGLTCRQVKAVLNTCAANDSVAGWRIRRTSEGRIRFTNRSNGKRRFSVNPVGGSPQCLQAL